MISLAIHGGAGTITKTSMTAEKEKAYTSALKVALNAGFKVLESNGSAVDAVEAAVIELENSPLFNAGRGSVFTAEGKHEMDASIMDGSNLEAGAVTLVKQVKNPISLARKVMEHSVHVLLSGEGAEQFARNHGLSLEKQEYFYNEFRYRQWQQIKHTDKVQLDHTEQPKNLKGTVGAVALDVHGNVAAATSTGGMTNKRFGRIGDSPVIGSGTYANNKTCAVSCTGDGEYFMRAVSAYDVSALMEYKGVSLEEACRIVIKEKQPAIGGDGGLIALDVYGNITMPFCSEGMYRACRSSGGRYEVKIY